MTPQPRKIYLLLVFLCLNFSILAQSEVDSLRYRVNETTGKEKVDAMNALASRLQTISPEEALETLDQSIHLSVQLEYDLGEVDAHLVRATVFSLKRQYPRAKQYLDKAFEILEDAPDQRRLANAYLVSSSHQSRQNQFDLSVENALNGLSIAREIPDQFLEASFLLNIGFNYEILGNLEQAGAYTLKALEVYEEIGEQYRMGQTYINLAVLEYKKHNLGLSIEFNQKALDIFTKHEDKAQIALSLQNLGFAYWQLKQYRKSLNYYKKSQAIREEIRDLYGLGKLWLNKAKLHHSMNRNETVLEATQQALDYANQIGNKILARDIYSFLHQYHLDRADFEPALINFKQYVLVRDSLSIQANTERIEVMRAEFEFEELTNENQVQAKDNEIKSLQIRQRNYVISGFFFLFLFGIRMMVLQRRKFSIKFQLGEKSRLLAEKEAALVTAQLQAEQRQLLSFRDQLNLKDEILALTKAKLSENENGHNWGEGQISEFIEKLNLSLGQQDWARFKLHFETVYPRFFDKLKQHKTQLGKNDDLLSAMIKIKLSNKEIATALNITPESVGRAKNRLKMKMGFATYNDLENHLTNL